MKRLSVLAAALSLALVTILAIGAVIASASSTTRSFALAGPNISVASGSDMMTSPGDTIRVTGSGTFDPLAGTVKAKGKFTHYTSEGVIHCKGTWTATSFTSFLSFGANEDGQEGGVLSLVVTHYCSTMDMTMMGIPMTVTSTVNAPEGYVEGVTMGMFDTPTRGAVVIEAEQ